MPSHTSSQPSVPESDHTVTDTTDQQPKLDSLVSGRNSIQAITTEPAEAASQGEEPKDQGQKKVKADGEGRSKSRNQRRKNNKNKNSHGNGNSNGNNNHGNKAAAKPQDVDGNTDPNAVGHVGTSLNLTLSKALMTKLKRQSKTEGVSMEALATELISEGCVLRAWEIVERKGHLRDASANQSGNSYGNGNGGGQRRGNGNNRNDNGRQQKNGNSRNMNKQRYNAIMDDKANFLEYVRNQEKYNR